MAADQYQITITTKRYLATRAVTFRANWFDKALYFNPGDEVQLSPEVFAQIERESPGALMEMDSRSGTRAD